MPEIDPQIVATFIEAQGQFAAAALRLPVDTSDPSSVYRRLRASRSPIGAMFRGLEQAVGPEEALEAVAAIHVAADATDHG